MSREKNKLQYKMYGSTLFCSDGTAYSVYPVLSIRKGKVNKKNNCLYVETGIGRFKMKDVMAALFLNNEEFPDSFSEWTVELKDGDPMNCSVDNIILNKKPNPNIGRKKGSLSKNKDFFLVDLQCNDYFQKDFGEILNIIDYSKAEIMKRIRNYEKTEEYEPFSGRYYVVRNEVDAWSLMN